MSYIGRPNSLYRLNVPSRSSANNDPRNGGSISGPKPEAADNRNRFTNVFGYNRASFEFQDCNCLDRIRLEIYLVESTHI